MWTKNLRVVALLSTGRASAVIINEKETYLILVRASVLLSTWALMLNRENIPDHILLILLIAISILIRAFRGWSLEALCMCAWLRLIPSAIAIMNDWRRDWYKQTILIIVWTLLSLQQLNARDFEWTYEIIIGAAVIGIISGFVLIMKPPQQLKEYIDNMTYADENGRLFVTFLCSSGFIYLYTTRFASLYHLCKDAGVFEKLKDRPKKKRKRNENCEL